MTGRHMTSTRIRIHHAGAWLRIKVADLRRWLSPMRSAKLVALVIAEKGTNAFAAKVRDSVGSGLR